LGTDQTTANDRVFDLVASAALDLSRVSLTGGAATGSSGGAIRVSDGELTVTEAAFVGNAADSGGAIRVAGSSAEATILRSVFLDNTTTGGGAAIYHGDLNSTVLIGQSVFAGNTGASLIHKEDGTQNLGYNLTDNGTIFFDEALGDHIATTTPDYVVTSIADEITEADDAFALSLREAVIAANAAGGVVWVPGWRHRLTRAGTEAGDATFNDLDITGAVTILGTSANSATIDANGFDHVFQLTADATIGRLTLTGAAEEGVYASSGDLNIDKAEIAGNGGGIYYNSAGTLTVSASTIAENEGRGVFVAAHSVLLTNTTISNNVTDENGAGIYVAYRTSAQEVTLVHLTITENHALASTSTGSLPTDKAGGIYVEADMDVLMYNTIVAYNFAGISDVNSDLGVGGTSPYQGTIGGIGNLIGVVGNTNYYGAAYFIGTNDPGLADLGYYGGPTRTHVPLSTGTWFNNIIDGADTTATVAYGLEDDQRGLDRLIDFTGINRPGLRSDIGAVELADGEIHS
jgi:hypothetical protein